MNTMIFRRIQIAVLFLLPLISMAQHPAGQPLPPAESKMRLQQLGDSMRKYDAFYSFDRNGLAVVANNSKTPSGERISRFGLVNEKGELVLPCEHDRIFHQNHSDLILVSSGGLAGFVDPQMHWVIPIQYQDIYSDLETDDYFLFGLVEVVDSFDKWGVLDSTGRQILPCQYDWVSILTPNLFSVNLDGKYGVVNRNGKAVIPIIYSGLRFSDRYDHYDSYIVAEYNNKQGVIDTMGNIVIPFQYELVGFSLNGSHFPVCENYKWGVVDITGEILIPCTYKEYLYEGVPGLWVYKQYVRGDSKLGGINIHGDVVLPCENDMIHFSKSGDKIVAVRSDSLDNEKCYLYNLSGTLLDSLDGFSYDWMDENHITMIPVKRDGKWGFYNLDFRLILPFLYDNASGYDGYGMVALPDHQTALLNERGEVLLKLPFKFNNTFVTPCINGWYHLHYNDVQTPRPPKPLELFGFIDIYGNSTFTKEEWERMKSYR